MPGVLLFSSPPFGTRTMAAAGGTFALTGNAATLDNSTIVQPVVKPFNIVLQYTTAALAQPQAWRNGIQTAANVLMTLIKDTAKVYIGVDVIASSAGSSGGPQTSATMTYTAVRSALSAMPNPTASYTGWFNALPTGSTSPQGVSTVFLTGAVAKARNVGGIADNPLQPDGSISVGDSTNLTSLVGVGLHEITHALGRSAAEPTYIWGKFKNGDGSRVTNTSFIAAGYFSVDNGITNLINYDDSNNDPSDFKGDTRDVFNAIYDPANPYTQALSAVDIQLIETLGYSVQ